MNTFLDFLRDRIKRVREAEENALRLLHEKNDESGYREAMRRKAEILAEMHSQAGPALTTAPATRRKALEDRLYAFSGSARRSLDLDSVFYMSALLYPEDHQPGQPNTLEVWLADLEREM